MNKSEKRWLGIDWKIFMIPKISPNEPLKSLFFVFEIAPIGISNHLWKA